MLLRLPVELYRYILGFLRHRDIVSLSSTARAFRDEAESFLYHQVDPQTFQRCQQLVKELSACTRKALLVRELTLSYVSFDSIPSIKLTTALNQTSNLVSLDIQGCQMLPHSVSLSGCTFRLEIFKCSLIYDQKLVDFFVSQPTIRSLSWFSTARAAGSPSVYLPPSALPCLTSLEGYLPDIILLLPNRPVTHVSMITQDQVDVVNVFPSVSVLRIACPLFSMEWSKILSMHPHLIYLECCIMFYDEFHVIEAIEKLPSLKILVANEAESEVDTFISNLFKQSTFLQMANTHWKRGVEKGMPVKELWDWRDV